MLTEERTAFDAAAALKRGTLVVTGSRIVLTAIPPFIELLVWCEQAKKHISKKLIFALGRPSLCLVKTARSAYRLSSSRGHVFSTSLKHKQSMTPAELISPSHS